MRKILSILLPLLALCSCEKNGINRGFELSLDHCVLDNNNSYMEVLVSGMKGGKDVISSDSNVAEILFDEEKEDVFYVVGHNIGKAIVTVVDVDYNKSGEYDTKSIEVEVLEPISYPTWSGEVLYIKKGESRVFTLPFPLESQHALEINNSGIASLTYNYGLKDKFLITGNQNGSTTIELKKGKHVVTQYTINVVEEYDLYVPQKQITFKLPYSYGISGFSVWRGSGRYEVVLSDDTIAEIKAAEAYMPYFNGMANPYSIWLTPLKPGFCTLAVMDTITGQTAKVEVIVY